MAKVLRWGRCASSKLQQITPAIYRRRTQEGVAPLLGSSSAAPAAGMGRLIHTTRAMCNQKRSLSDLEKLKSDYVHTRGKFQAKVTKFSILHLSEKLDTVQNRMLLYRHYWHWPAWLVVIVVSVGVEIFMFTNVLDKKECEDLTASVNQVSEPMAKAHRWNFLGRKGVSK